MLKGRSLKSFVASVVFSFSLVVACISPVWAVSPATASYDDAHGLTLYASEPLVDPLRQGQSFSLPLFDRFGVSVLSDGFSYRYGYQFQSNQFKPFSFDVSLVLGFTVIVLPGGSVTASHDSLAYKIRASSEYFRGGVSDPSTSFEVPGSLVTNVWDNRSAFAPYFVVSYTLPAGTNGVFYSGYPWPSLTVSGKDALLSCVTAYVVYSSDQDVVHQVNAILDEVRKVNGNLTSTLSVLNEILGQCREIKADTASILSILGLCKDQLVTLNGKVDDIYKLLKDSLATESQALDQKSENVAGQIMQRVDSEQFWTDKNTENFDALDMGNWSFGDGVVGALPTVGNLFKSLWDSIGESTLIFVFPLMLGIALVIVGRLSRTAGKGSKKGGGDDG